MLDIRPIRTADDHAWALSQVNRFDDDTYEPGTPHSDRFDVLVSLIMEYEAKHFPIQKSDPIEVLHFAFSSMGRSQKELADLLGSAPRASEILNRKRPLTLEMIRTISEAWHIPIGALTGSYALEREYA